VGVEELDPSGPGTNCGVAATVRVQDGKGISGPRLRSDRDKDPAPPDQRFENPPVMGLKADSTHRGRKAQLRQVLRHAL